MLWEQAVQTLAFWVLPFHTIHLFFIEAPFKEDDDRFSKTRVRCDPFGLSWVFLNLLPVDASCAYQWTLPFTLHLPRWTCNGHWQQQFLYDHSSGTIGLSTDQTHCSIILKELMPWILFPKCHQLGLHYFHWNQKLERITRWNASFFSEGLWSMLVSSCSGQLQVPGSSNPGLCLQTSGHLSRDGGWQRRRHDFRLFFARSEWFITF